MSVTYIGNGQEEIFIGTKKIILDELEKEELREAIALEDDKDDIIADLRTENQNILAENERLKDTINEIQNENWFRGIDAMDLMEFLLQLAPDLTLQEVMIMRDDNSYIYKITKAVKNDDRYELEKIINEIKENNEK